MRRVIAGFVVGLIAACAGPAVARNFESDNDSLSGGIVRFEGHTFLCITYTKVDRGGLWCERDDQ